MSAATRQRWFLRGLCAVAAASLLLALLTFADAWQRPVSAVSDIPGRSAIVDSVSGVVRTLPDSRYDADLRPGDLIIAYDGMTWPQTKRLNLAERSEHQPGDTIALVVRRGARQFATHTRVLLPDAHEQLVLARLAISALLCWLPATWVLLLYLRRERASAQPFSAPSSIPLWFLAWQTISVAQSLNSIKYPVAAMLTSALYSLAQMLIGLLSLPYPLAPPHRRPRWLVKLLLLLGVASFVAICAGALRSPYPSPDWRRSVQILLSSDPVWQVTLLVGLAGIMLAVGGTLLTAISPNLRAGLHWLARGLPAPARAACLAAIGWFERTYAQSAPGVFVIAQFQGLVIMLYLLLDRLPTAFGGAGGGYSVLFAAIPFSYLLLYGDTRTQIYGQRLNRALMIAVLIIQVPVTSYRLWSGSYGAGANAADYLTLALIGGTTLIGGLLLALDQRQRLRAAPDPAQAALARLFDAPSRAAFWERLTDDFGPRIGVTTWLWATRGAAGAWSIIGATDHARAAWLNEPSVRAALDGWRPLRPLNCTVDTGELPSTLIMLPIPHDGALNELLIAANPLRLSDSARLANGALVHYPLINALQAVRNVARQRQLLAAYQRIERQERDEQRVTGVRVIARLHDHALQELARLVQEVRQMQRGTQARTVGGGDTSVGDERADLDGLVRDLIAINAEIKGSLKDLRLRAVKQRLNDTLDDLVSVWEQQHPSVYFSYDAPHRDPPLNEEQREIVRLIVKEAVANALKHAAPTRITLTLQPEPGALLVSVRDNGRGFDPAALDADSGALGLLLLPDLAAQIGSSLTVDSAPGQGCTVLLRVPFGDEQ